MRLKIYGPPGTGKTSSLTALTKTAVSHHADRVLVASLTRAAAAELAGRNLSLPRENIGTLHHHCFRALGSPPLVVKHIKEWNDLKPEYTLSSEGSDEPEGRGGGGSAPGDEFMARYDLLRHGMRPRELWDQDTLAFAKAWESWKSECFYLDFTDLLEQALDTEPPGSPDAGIFDEVQDFSRLEFALLEKWAESMDSVALAGDEDQTLYSWRGADPQAMVDFPQDDQRILGQSYRIPALVHEFSQKWIAQISSRVDKPFKPREERGVLGVRPWAFAFDADQILYDAEEHVADGKTVMILASCEYMLRPIVAEARRLGIPFQNKYRRRQRAWNPLYASRGIPAYERLLTYLRPDQATWGEAARLWTGSEMGIWSKPLKAEVLGGRADVAGLDGESSITPTWLASHVPEEWADILDVTLDAFDRALLGSEADHYTYPLAVAGRSGARTLKDEPKITIGTIHSVKGGEADVVYLSPELSPSGENDWLEYRDPVIRQFYVGITRARETLILCEAKPRAYSLDDLIHMAVETAA